MTSNRTFQIFLGLYISIFFLYLFGPLIIMSVTAFNSAEFPSITPWSVLAFGGSMKEKLHMMVRD